MEKVALFDQKSKKYIKSVDRTVIYYVDYPKYCWNIVKDDKTESYIIRDSKSLKNFSNNMILSIDNNLLFHMNKDELFNNNYIFKIINYSPSLGICNWSSLYRFTNKNLLEEGNIVINNNFKCFNTIKIYLGKRSSRIYGFNESVSGKKLVEIAQMEYYKNLFSNSSFSTIILVCHSTHHSRSNYWNDSFTEEDKTKEIQEFNDLSMYLRTFLKKTFILQNWESDNYKNKSPNSTQRMIEWITARQDGIDLYRKQFVYIKYGFVQLFGDNVFHAIEVNKVKDDNSCVYKVLPYIRVDLISYSCYETQQNSQEFEHAVKIILDRIDRRRDYTNGQIPPCLKNFPVGLYIGEYGLSNKHFDENMVINTLNNVYRVGCKYRLPYINFWNLYNNEPDNDFGLIDKDGQFTLSGKLFNSLRR